VGKWSRTLLGDVVIHQKGFAFKSSDYRSSGDPIVRVSNFTDRSINMAACNFLQPENLAQYSDFIIRTGDTVIATVGSWPNNLASVVGKVIRVPHAADGALLNQNAVRLRGRSHLDQGFLFYILKTEDFQNYIIGTAQGSANQASITLKDIFGFEFLLPPLAEQCRISSIFGSLDDKIELNRRINETLESIARAIFKSWFVDFDPVRAKAEGRDTGLPKHIADLFPDSFMDSELGEIPKGWTVGRLGNVLQQRVERCAPSSETAAQPYVPIDCISSKSLFLTESKPGLEAQSSLTRFYKGDLLFGAMRPYFHKVCIAPFTGTTRTTAFVLYPVVRDDFSFATLILHNTDTIDYATRHSTGSTIPYAVWPSSLQDMPISLPLVKVRSAYDRVVRPILDRIPERYFEHRTLTDIRDTLLPKLISGELRIKNAEKFLEKRL
jgi:type I restriction enzyme, S subunit